MGKRLLDINPLTGMAVSFEWNDAEGSLTIGHHQDPTNVIENNKWALLDIETHRKQAKKDWIHYAKIDEIVILEWKQKYGVDFYNPNHWKRVMQLLNDPDYKYLKRTSYKHDR